MSDDPLLTEAQISDLVALLARRGPAEALGFLLAAIWYATQGIEVSPDWAALGAEDRAAEIVEGRISGASRPPASQGGEQSGG
ncbi:MAG: hypothetical protein H5T60_09300 [Anaerolineae bacterium]|nr:hypothetical protein [Anaerolineae bacterium]